MQTTHKFRIDIILTTIFVLIPICIWLFMQPIAPRFSTSFMFWTSLGQITSIIGTTLVALSMIFQIRLGKYFTFLSKPTTMTNFHHYTGVYGLFFLILHPIFLAMRAISISPISGFNFIFTTDIINLTALIALIFMILSVYVTLFVQRSFRYWKLFHQLMLLAYLLIIYHLIFTTSDISRNVPLRIYIFSLMIIGGFAFGVQKIMYYNKKYFSNKEVVN